LGNLGVARVIACAAWRCHASALFLGALTLPQNPRPIGFEILNHYFIFLRRELHEYTFSRCMLGQAR
jgi:hypothetical protein